MKRIALLALMLSLLVGCAAKSTKTTAVSVDMDAAIAKALEKNPDLIIKALKARKLQVLSIVEQGARMREAEKRVLRWKMEAADPLKPKIDADRAIYGDVKAPITIVEYTDFLCPYCSRGAATAKAVVNESKGKVRLVMKHLPMKKHSFKLALIFEAVAVQDKAKAWKVKEMFFESQPLLAKGDQAAIDAILKQAGVDIVRLKKDMQSPAVVNRIQDDMAEANKFGLRGTPMFVINGVVLPGAFPQSDFNTVIQIVKDSKSACLDCDPT